MDFFAAAAAPDAASSWSSASRGVRLHECEYGAETIRKKGIIVSQDSQCASNDGLTHLPITPQIHEQLDVRQPLKIIRHVIHFRSLEGSMAGVPMVACIIRRRAWRVWRLLRVLCLFLGDVEIIVGFVVGLGNRIVGLRVSQGLGCKEGGR